jgi:hypothetical protein
MGALHSSAPASRRTKVQLRAAAAVIEICFQPKEEINLSAGRSNVNWKMGLRLRKAEFLEII